MPNGWLVRCGVAVLGIVAAGPLRAQGVVEVQVSPPQVQLQPGERTQAFATAYAADNSVVFVTEFRWSSSDTTVVRILSETQAPEVGTLVAVGPGAATVIAQVGAVRGFTTVQVTAPAPPAPPPPLVVAPPVLDSVLPAEVAAAARRSMVRVETRRFGVPSACYTAIRTGNGVLLTSYQAIRGADRISVVPEGSLVPQDAQIAAYNVAADIAVLRVAPGPGDSLSIAARVADDQYAWVVGYPQCAAAASTGRVRVQPWQDRPNGPLRHTGTLSESYQGAALIDQSGAVVGLVNGERTVAAPFTRLQSVLADGRTAVSAQRLQAPADVSRIENHAYGSFVARSDLPNAVARVTPLEGWQWSGLARESTLPLTFTGPVGRYQVDLVSGGTVRATTTARITAGTSTEVVLAPPAPVAQAAPVPRPTPAAPAPAQPQVRRGGGGGAVVPIILLLAGGGGAAAYFLTRSKDDSTGTPTTPGSITISIPNP